MVVRYRCEKCGHVCTEREMVSDSIATNEDEVWSNWICPKCGTWHPALDDGWMVEET
jgi:predicted RNA-binding Zn-ribbon protein involved in translation (DUF1610 family)